MQTLPPAGVLVIDEIPLIAVGLQAVLRTMYPLIQVEHLDSVFTALSSKAFEGRLFEVVILGSGEESSSADLLSAVSALKERFPASRIMVYTDQYDPAVIAKIQERTPDACVHKFEPAEEIRRAYFQLIAGGTYLSPIFDTLYHSYRLNL
jgi:DNA-binding NarL/FixJ family response regulator